MNTTYAVYLGKEQQNGFTGFHSEKNFYCVVEIFDGYTLEQGEDLMSALAQAGAAEFDSLVGFDAAISSILRRHNIPLDTSVAVGYFKEDVLYLKTVGSGEVYIHRGRATERIIFGNTMASGRCKKNDSYIFTTSFFTQSLKGVQRLKDCFSSHHTLVEYPDYIKSQIDHEDDTGAVALIVRTGEDTNEVVPSETNTNTSVFQGVGQRITTFPYKRPLLIGVLTLCIAALLWNVAGGFVSKKNGASTQSFEKVESLITEIESSKDDTTKALDLVNQARSELKIMKQSEKVNELNARLQTIEDEVLGRQTKGSELFYDLTIEEKTAKGHKITVSGDIAYILDESGSIYVFSLEKKSLEKRSYSKQIAKESVVAGYENKAYVLDPAIGIIELDENNKSKVVVARDEAWSNIGGMHLYNGNIYILSRGDGDIYKYLVFSEGFGDKSSYFKGSYDLIEDSSTFAIDSSIYVLSSKGITKYTSGLKDTIEFTFPQDNLTLTKVLAHPDESELVVWNKTDGVVYVFTKEGGYQKQIVNDKLKKASDIELYNSQLFLLLGNTIFKIDLK